MLAELGQATDAALERGSDVAHEAVHATVVHVRRIAGVVSSAAVRVAREVEDLAWDYRDVAGDLRRSASRGNHLPVVGPIDLREPSKPSIRL